ncbi:MAG TPA: glycosyltransferase [Oligoflexia bacterium]|nr:glycosyltransferase [Oligoflexia bacterium]HMP47408.1 glycosyltransferase [Oligoflexia bacterium]
MLDKFQLRFGGVPNPDANYLPPENIQFHSSCLHTPYGHMAEAGEASFSLKIPLRESNHNLCSFNLQFASFPVPSKPKLRLLGSDNQETISEIQLRMTSANTAEALFDIPQNAANIEVILSEEPAFFSVHNASIKTLSTSEIAEIDTRRNNYKHRLVICFPVIDWEFRQQRPQHLLRELAKSGDHVVYLSTSLSGYGTNEATAIPLEERVTKLYIPGNPRLNLYKHTPSSRSVDLGCNAITNFILQRAFEDVILLVHLPFWLPYALKLKSERGYKIVYDCMDDHSGFENNSTEMLQAESKLRDNSDLLITTSGKLFEENKNHKNCVLIRNAGDPEHFKIAENKIPLSSKFIPSKGPVIGYFGAIAEWFDEEAITHAAKNAPSDWSFILIGHHTEEIKERFADFTNVYFPGEIPYTELPKYLSHFDVCTIPFKKIPLTEATNPVKLYEYFSTGKPVVARNLPEIEIFSDLTYIYDSPESLIDNLKDALSESLSDQKRVLRKEIANKNTWTSRSDVLKSEISKLQKKVSIIIISYEAFPYLRECISSILANTSYDNFEIIIVDNASSRSVRDYLIAAEQSSPKIKVILNDENRGFAAANNQGLSLANDSDYFILLNNDTVVPSGWLERLIYYADQQGLGIIGPVTNWTGNEAMIPTSYRSLTEMGQFAWGLRNQYQGEFFDIKVAAMFCVAFRKEILEKVGYLDESFGIGMFEDDDYATRVRAAGFRVVCAEDVFVHHYGSVSFNQLPKDTYNEIFSKNKAEYEKKWGTWIPHQAR